MVIDEKKDRRRGWERIKNLDTGFDLVGTPLTDVSIAFLVRNWRSISLFFSRFNVRGNMFLSEELEENATIIQTLRKTTSQAHPTKVISSSQGHVFQFSNF